MAASGVKIRLEKQRSKGRRWKISSRTDLNGGDLVRSTFLVLTFAFALAFMVTFVLALVLAFLSPFGGKSLPVCGATVKKGVSWAGVESSSLEPLAGPLPVHPRTTDEPPFFFFPALPDMVGQQLELV